MYKYTVTKGKMRLCNEPARAVMSGTIEVDNINTTCCLMRSRYENTSYYKLLVRTALGKWQSITLNKHEDSSLRGGDKRTQVTLKLTKDRQGKLVCYIKVVQAVISKHGTHKYGLTGPIKSLVKAGKPNLQDKYK